MDVKTTFFYKKFKEEVYMIQLQGFIVEGKKYLICRLHKAFYRIKQTQRHGMTKSTLSFEIKALQKKKVITISMSFITIKIIYFSSFI